MRSSIEDLSNIYTGSDIFIIDFPDTKFDPNCFMIIFRISFWAAKTYSSIKSY